MYNCKQATREKLKNVDLKKKKETAEVIMDE